MPQINTKTGRQLSGAQKRKAAAAKAAGYVARAKKAKPAPAAPAAPATSPAADFARLPPVQIGDPAAAIAWCNDAMLIAFEQVLREPALLPPQRWGWIDRFGRALGYLKDKASAQTAIKRALGSQQAAQQAQGTVSANGRVKTAVPRPPS